MVGRLSGVCWQEEGRLGSQTLSQEKTFGLGGMKEEKRGEARSEKRETRNEKREERREKEKREGEEDGGTWYEMKDGIAVRRIMQRKRRKAPDTAG